jgi:hypothetical protein
MSSCKGRTHRREKKGTLKYIIDLEIDRVRHSTGNKTDMTAHIRSISHMHFQLFRGSYLRRAGFRGSFLIST